MPNANVSLEYSQVDRVFTDKASGKDTERPELEALLNFVREGGTVVVHSMDRMARKIDDLRRLVQSLTKRGVRIEFRPFGCASSWLASPSCGSFEVGVRTLCQPTLGIPKGGAVSRILSAVCLNVLDRRLEAATPRVRWRTFLNFFDKIFGGCRTEKRAAEPLG